jgi:tetratricopeptide (TPR) repeat protein
MAVLLLVGIASCQQGARSLREAETLFQQGVERRADKHTEAAAECFSQALLAINQCDARKPEVKKLKAQIEDNLGAMCWKHGLSDDALQLHLDAVALLRELYEPALLMKALRNCGRVTATLQGVNEAQIYYDEARQIAEKQHDKAFCNELLMETSHDLYLESGDYTKAIEDASKALAGGADPGFCNLVIGLAHYYLDENKEALGFLDEATRSEKPSIRMSAYQALYLIRQSMGNYQEALRCHELYNENMLQDDADFRGEQLERIKSDYELKMQMNRMKSEQKLKYLNFYIIVGTLVVVLVVVLLLLRQKTLSERLKSADMQNQLESALKKNKVYVTALALSEQITASTLDFDLKEIDWDDFVTLIDKVYGDFTQRLITQYPTLTKSDLQICCLTKQGFSNQVISILMNIQTGSYARRKSRIKQEKMDGLNDERSFEEIINEI